MSTSPHATPGTQRKTTVMPDPDGCIQLYTTTEVAEMLRCSTNQVRNLMHAGVLPSVKFGRLLRFKETDVAAFIHKHIQGGGD